MLALCFVSSLSSAGCDDGVTSDPGLSAALRVDPGQYVKGDMPEPGTGPALRNPYAPHDQLLVGSIDEFVAGSADRITTSVAVGRVGDPGYWIVTAGYPTADEPELASFRANLVLARDFPVGPFTLQLSALDRAGDVGPRAYLNLEAVAAESTGVLVVTLRWDNDADLDVHVQTPRGIDIWSRNINEYDPQTAADDETWQNGGLLDIDSNANCQADGHSIERVTWAQTATSGQYTVRVVTASLCGETAAHWSADAVFQGQRLAAASGTSVGTDTREGDGARAGVVAFSFTVP
jgi:hypothetical protein